jgi:hypothetical protein
MTEMLHLWTGTIPAYFEFYKMSLHEIVTVNKGFV